MLKSGLRIQLVSNESEMHRLLRLRYDVFWSEMQDDRYADHVARTWGDDDDHQICHQLLASNEQGAAVGTLRLTLLREAKFIAVERYDFASLADALGRAPSELLETIARVDRVAIAKEYRGCWLVRDLQVFAEELARTKGASVLVAAQHEANERARATNEFLGWKEYRSDTQADFAAILVYKLL